MDIFIANVPLHTNQAELRLFLIDILDHFDILAFDLVKHIGIFVLASFTSPEYADLFLLIKAKTAPSLQLPTRKTL